MITISRLPGRGAAFSKILQLLLASAMLLCTSYATRAQAPRQLPPEDLVLEQLRQHDAMTQLDVINHYFNALRQVPDRTNWNREDYWATPGEVLARGGDCEDLAAAKYHALRRLGFPESNLKLTYTRQYDQARKAIGLHMVLVYNNAESGKSLVLDNTTSDIYPLATRNDLVPLLAFNTRGVWEYDESLGLTYVGTAQRLPIWVDWLSRVEGLPTLVAMN